MFYLQTIRHSYFVAQADAVRVNKNILPASRGQLVDRNGDVLAINVPAKEIYADPRDVQDRAAVAASLAPLLGMDQTLLEQKLDPGPNKRRRYVSLMRHASLELGNQVKDLRLRGIGVGPDTRRSYPNGSLAAQMLGFTDRDSNGVEGLEHSQDKLLSGRDGLLVGEVDPVGRFLPGTIRRQTEPVNGADLVLTIDKSLQHAADTELAAAVKAHNAKSGVVIILDPRNGEILALSNAPTFDPNSPKPPGPLTQAQGLAASALWRNGAVSDLYEPGSTMKTITSAAVVQTKGLGVMNDYVTCNAVWQYGGHTIHCAQDPPYYGHHGTENLRGVLKESCNIGMAQFGLKIGPDNLYKYLQAFGFMDYAHSGLPGEQKSWLKSPDEFNKYTGSVGWSKIQFANITFGQGVAVTPLQMATAYGAIANHGVMMRPHIIKATRKGEEETQVQPEAIRQVVDPQTAETVCSMLGTVVQEGTGKPAQIAGFSVGGKTGSAQVAGPHGYRDPRYVASFIGMVPLSKPRLVILCAVFEPQGVHWGAAVAAPVVHNLAKMAVLEMHLTPDAPDLVDWADHKKKKLPPTHVSIDTIGIAAPATKPTISAPVD
ncbi:stage V sporulation protein D [Capsulimonas corticalis]|uniref:Stage V sporulation protein D n=1 Tax=Capsulimonas corticalis TaxID=2219043 RepID=A0A402D3C9_9BACT|nr:stage V sporulation protein D [Capsulimonas corticalis]